MPETLDPPTAAQPPGAPVAVIGPTITPTEAAARVWDAVVIGAGPAGSVAALGLARAGARILLVDKAAFPRPKVCGCCINSAAMGELSAEGLSNRMHALGAMPLRRLVIAMNGRRLSAELPGGVALSRAALDAELVCSAIRAGAEFLPETAGAFGAHIGAIVIRSGGEARHVRSRAIIVADGLGGRVLAQEPGFEPEVSPGSRMGAAAIAADSTPVPVGEVRIAIARGGYVGLVRLEDDRLDIAAAFDPAFVRSAGGPGPAAESILRSAGCDPVPAIEDIAWRGTPALTRRRRRLASAGLFVIGDAAAYTEPFTGEGIAWALASGRAVVPRVMRALRGGTDAPAGWTRDHGRRLQRRQRPSRIVSALLRRPRLAASAFAIAQAAPRLLGTIVRAVGKPPRVVRMASPERRP